MKSFLFRLRAGLLLTCPIAIAFAFPFVMPLIHSSEFYGHGSNAAAYNIQLNNGESLSDYQGRFTYLFLGFQGCSQACPRQLLNLAALANSNQLKQAQFLYVDLVAGSASNVVAEHSVDNVLFRQVANFQQATEVSQQFPGYVASNFDAQIVDHSAYLYLLDPRGEVSLVYTQVNLEIDKVIQDFKQLQQGEIL
ncbi:hypothetical protein [Agarivorans sp. Toyoura001]|uniref:SCO family protein n=1 Tax=Agarivorans sp. Toyoura001 TaxID=2283141 RepID=UPI0010F8A847|nr:hypothetical protein [Agarivorans sp. Toyoura001]